jgi:light-regulated signal transduction histidine kinase (bacteriophytochrome)
MKTSVLQIRLVRASELNSHLKEMNLAAAGLAHETRNPLNIIRGMAQMLSKEATAPPKSATRPAPSWTRRTRSPRSSPSSSTTRARAKSAAPRSRLPAINEVVRTLNRDIEEKKLRVDTLGEPLVIEADEQMLRQVLFNLLHNGIQAIGENGVIQIQSRRAVPARRRWKSAMTAPACRPNAAGNFQALLHHASKRHRPRPRRRAANGSGARMGNRMPAQRTQRRDLPHQPFETDRLSGDGQNRRRCWF